MYRVCSLFLALFVLVIAAVLSGCGSSSAPISVSLSPSSSQAIDQSQTVVSTASVQNDTSGKGVSWTLTGPGSLSARTSSSVTYNSPTPGLSSSQQVTVTATSASDLSKIASLQITVNPYLQIPFQSLSAGSVGTPYSQTVMLAGGTAPFQWSVYNGQIGRA